MSRLPLRVRGSRIALLLALLAGCDSAAPRRSAAPADAGKVPKQMAMDAAATPSDAAAATSDAKGNARTDAARDAALDPAAIQRARGEYLVRHVAACNECHTPRLPSGEFDETKLLSGVENLIDVEPGDDNRGMIHSRNLTPDMQTGLGKWSDDQIKKALQQGVDDEGKTLHWMMPYWIFRNMKQDDADAIVAYVRSLPALAHEVPENQPNAISDGKVAAYELPSTAIPDSTLDEAHPDRASAERGRYLASSVAPCMLCHSPTLPSDATVPIDVARVFSGKRKLTPVKLGTPVDKGAPLIDTYNLTPHTNGIGGWSAMDIATTLRMGVSRDSLPVCDPMPSYMGGSFLGMTEDDALDLGHYFTTIPPQDSGPIAKCCNACHGSKTGATSDAGL